MISVTKLERKESIKIYKKILVIQFKSPKFSFLYKIGEIKSHTQSEILWDPF